MGRGLNPRVLIRSDKDSHFTTQLVTGAIETENLSFVLNDKLAKGIIREIRVISDQNLAWEVQIHFKDTFASATDADLDTFVFAKRFATGDGYQNAGAGPYRYVCSGLDVAYHDKDRTGEVHVAVLNRSATTKNSGATGECVVEIEMEVV